MTDTSRSYMTYYAWLDDIYARLSFYEQYRQNNSSVKDGYLSDKLSKMRAKLLDEIPFYIKLDDGYDLWCKHVQNEFAEILTGHILFMAASQKIQNVKIINK